jgi:hypothetical protein
MNVKNLINWHILNHHIFIWKNTNLEFKIMKIDHKMYQKYSFYIGHYIFEIGKFKYGTNNKSVRTNRKQSKSCCGWKI